MIRPGMVYRARAEVPCVFTWPHRVLMNDIGIIPIKMKKGRAWRHPTRKRWLFQADESMQMFLVGPEYIRIGALLGVFSEP